MRRRFIVSFCLYFFFFGTSTTIAEIFVPASSPQINYYGRFDFSTAGAAKFNWSGATIEASFEGPSIGIALQDGQSDYDVELDGKLQSPIRTASATNKYTIASNLTNQTHIIRVIQRSENHWNAAQFNGFYVADGKSLVSPPQKPAKKIEFIGDSYTVGYGNESPSKTCSQTQLRQYTNTNRSFSTLVTAAFHAQNITLGWSGQGMVRNYGEATKKSQTPYPYYYKKTLGVSYEAFTWDFTKWIPDLVVICLGTNDFSTTPNPDDTMYANAYHTFIDTVRAKYPLVSILCVSTHTGPMDTYLKKIVADEVGARNHKNTYYAEFPQSLDMGGCDWHPTVKDDSLIASALVKSIMTNVKWDTAAAAILKNQNRTLKGKQSFFITPNKGGLLMELSAGTPQADIVMTNPRGQMLRKVSLYGNKPFWWNTSALKKGICLFNNPRLGATTAFLLPE